MEIDVSFGNFFRIVTVLTSISVGKSKNVASSEEIACCVRQSIVGGA